MAKEPFQEINVRKIVVAPDSFKGTMSSVEVCDIIKCAIGSVDRGIEVVTIPIADGGEGTVDAFLCAAGGKRVVATVKDPLMRDIQAYYGILSDGLTAVIEMAQASGIGYVENDLRPLEATSFGTGQLIKSALDAGCNKIILGLGGSATTDGGVGAAAALGVRFLSEDQREIPPNGGGLSLLQKIDADGIDQRLKNTEIILACDVDNCLCGEKGAAAIFGPQKGASLEQVGVLDRNLAHYAEVIKRRFGQDVTGIRGGGAAGGLGVSLITFADAQIISGIQVVLDTVKFSEIINGADLIITGEGRIDSQTALGKVPAGIARAAKHHGVPVIAIGGSLGKGYEAVYDEGITSVFSVVNDLVPFSAVKQTCRQDLYMLIKNLISAMNMNV
jgi:glycerate kinase